MTALAAAFLVAGFVMLAGAAIAAERRARHLEPRPERIAAERPLRPRSRAIEVAGAGAGVAVGAFLGGPPAAVLLGLGGGGVPVALARRRRQRRIAAMEEQLIDAVVALAASLRAGRSVQQGLAAARDEVSDPLGSILEAAESRLRLGTPFDVVVDELAEEIGGQDARLVAGVLRLHRRTGAALAAPLDELAATLRSRRDGHREVRSLTAQARLSAAILGLLPLGFFLFLSIVARRDVETAYRTPAGASAIALGVVLQGVAFVWIRRLLRVEDR